MDISSLRAKVIINYLKLKNEPTFIAGIEAVIRDDKYSLEKILVKDYSLYKGLYQAFNCTNKKKPPKNAQDRDHRSTTNDDDGPIAMAVETISGDKKYKNIFQYCSFKLKQVKQERSKGGVKGGRTTKKTLLHRL